MKKLKDAYIKECTLHGQFGFIFNKMVNYIWVFPLLMLYISYCLTKFIEIKSYIIITVITLVTTVIYIFVMILIAHKKINHLYGRKVKLKLNTLIDKDIEKDLSNKFLEFCKKYNLKKGDKRLECIIYLLYKESEKKKFDGIFEKALVSGIFLPIWIGFINEAYNSFNDLSIGEITGLLIGLGTLILIIILPIKSYLNMVFNDFLNIESKEYKDLANRLESFNLNLK